jgi:hypothetical protein
MSRTEASGRFAGASVREIVYLWLEVASTRVLMWVANPTGLHGFQPHVHLYLADRYGRLAAAYRHRSRFFMANRMADKANLHFDLGGGEHEPPPAAAVALGSTQRQVVVDAEGFVDPTLSEQKLLPFIPKKPIGLLEPKGRDV